MDPDAVKSTLSNLAFGNFLAAAARDYQKVALNGGIGGLLLDTIGHTFSKKYHNRVIQLDMLFGGLGFTLKKVDSQIRWSVLSTALILRRHEGARAKLAESMTMGKSVGTTTH